MEPSERHILIVDDEINILNALERLLEEEMHVTIHRAESGAEGKKVLSEYPQIGVVLSDQRMPAMTGTEFLKSVKQSHPNTVRMILSGYSELNTITDAINQGSIFKFITKPWENELIIQAITEAFEYHELIGQNLRLTHELQLSNNKLADLNKALEQRVESKTRKLQLHIASLKVYQEALEHLPYALIGIDDHHQIVLENIAARNLLFSENKSSLGLSLEDALSDSLKPLEKYIFNFFDSKSNHDKEYLINIDNKHVSVFNIGQSAESIGKLIFVSARLSNGDY